MIVKRDQTIINFLEDFRIANTGQLHRLFFPNTPVQYSSRRLKYLFDEGYIKRTRSTLTSGYAYYVGKKSGQMHHDLIRVELFITLKQLYTITEWGNEATIGNIRPDAVAIIDDHGIKFPVFIEIHLNNRFDFDKYKELLKTTDLKALFGLMPRVLICTEQKLTLPNIGIKFKLVSIDMSGIDSIFK
jgi:hypothetical protein